MPTSSVGTTNNHCTRSGVTLIEMLVVVAIISVLVGISYPALASGIDSLRLNAATRSVVSFFDAGLNRAQRLQQTVYITISLSNNDLELRSPDNPAFLRELDLPDGITISKILPEVADQTGPREFFLYPGGAVPKFGLQLMNRRHVERVVQVDAMTGVPVISEPQPSELQQ